MFSRKIKKLLYLTLLFNNIPLSNSLLQKDLGLTIDIKLTSQKIERVLPKKIVKLWVFYVTFNTFCQGHLFSLYINLL